jgi:hypothetical protein
MDNNADTPTLYMQRVKTQTEVLIPLLRHLRAELGEAEANALVYPVLRDYMKKWIAEFASTESDNPIENFHKTSDMLETMYEGDVDYDILKNDDDNLDLDVTGCRYADFFHQLDEPELGAILVCEVDEHIADLSAPNVEMSRADTIMKGGTHCPFRYRFSDAKSGE